MRTEWYLSDKKAWNLPGEDWLCFSRDDGEQDCELILHEGSHHYFEEIHLFRQTRSGDEVVACHRLPEVGPFQISLTERVAWQVIVKAKFLPYRTALPEGDRAANPCAVILQGGVESPVFIRLYPEMTKPGRVGRLEDPATVRKWLLEREKTTSPILRRVLDRTGSATVVLESAHDGPVRLHLYGMEHRECPRPPKPGTWLNPDEMKQNPCFAVAVQKEFAAQTKGTAIQDLDPGLTIAIPVAICPRTGRGLVGKPLAVGALLSPPGGDLNAMLKALPPDGVFAQWEWRGPVGWIDARLRWRFYDENGFDENTEEESLRVTFFEYRRRNTVEFLSYRRRGVAGWNIQIWLDALLLDEEVDFPPVSTYTGL